MDPVTGMMLAQGVGAVLGGLGSKKATPQVTGFQAMPKEVQDVFLKTYLPGVQEQYGKQYQAPPMKRVNKPQSPFDSQGLYDLQQYSDAMGGMFTPNTQAVGQRQQQQPAAPIAEPTPGGDNGYDGTAKNGDLRVFTEEEWVPGAPKPGKYIYQNGWKPFGQGRY